MDLTEFRESGIFFDEERPDDELRELIEDYVMEAIKPTKEVGHLQLPEMDYKCWITAGLSWGGSPTDIFDAINVASIGPLWDLTLEWSKADVAEARSQSEPANSSPQPA